MKLYRGLHNMPVLKKGCVASIGNFDGVHLGHQSMLKELDNKGQHHGVPRVVVLFEPQPLEFFLQKQAPARLSRLRDKLSYLARFKVDAVLCLAFNEALASHDPHTFANKILFERLNIKHLVVGEDFRFGRNRQGELSLLRELAAKQHCTLQALAAVTHQGRRISSTRVRTALSAGDLDEVHALLGRPFSLFGRVAHGAKLARQWGIPTANIYLHRLVAPIQGVFCVEALIEGELHLGVANVGTRPTVDGTQSLLEVHLLNFNRDIYGHNIEVRFVHKLRQEQKFSCLDSLKQQILSDVEDASLYFHPQTECIE